MLWDLRTDKRIKKYSGHQNAVRRVCNLNEDTIVSCGYDGEVIFWQVEGEKSDYKKKIKLFDNTDDLHTLAPLFDRDTPLIFVGGGNGSIGILDFEGNIVSQFSSSDYAVNYVEFLDCSPIKLVSACEDKILKVFEISID